MKFGRSKDLGETVREAVSRFPPYPEYRNPGVDGLPRIPVHWEVGRLKRTVESCQNGIWGDEPSAGSNGIRCVRVADFDRLRLTVREDSRTLRSVPPLERWGRLLHATDLLLEKSGGGDLQPVGVVVSYGLAELAVCSNFIARIAVAQGFDSRFVCYLHAGLYAAGINTRSIKQNTGIQNLDSAAYFNESVAFPPLDEQRAIAALLDRETAKIDSLVEKEERLIALLEEKRVAVITHAVTRGLDPSVPLKGTGIEWLGDVPSHWKLMRLAMAADTITNGYVGPTRDILVDAGIRYLQSLHIKNGEIRFDRPYYVTEEWSWAHRRSILRKGDVLIVQTGDIGQCCAVPERFVDCNCHALIIVRLKRGLGSGFFLSAYLRSDAGRNELLRAQTGALHPHLECGKVREIPIPLPPPTEQDRIVSFIEEQTAKIDALDTKVHEAIEKLREYRIALISAAVTGKIDVREPLFESNRTILPRPERSESHPSEDK
jgi:type I restriction enzyme, S subunit